MFPHPCLWIKIKFMKLDSFRNPCRPRINAFWEMSVDNRLNYWILILPHNRWYFAIYYYYVFNYFNLFTINEKKRTDIRIYLMTWACKSRILNAVYDAELELSHYFLVETFSFYLNFINYYHVIVLSRLTIKHLSIFSEAENYAFNKK